MTHADPQPPRSAETWNQIRADFMAGVSGPVLVERYGVPLRTLRHRAAVEGWRRQDHDPHRRRAAVLEAEPELAEVLEEEGLDQFRLLFEPQPDVLRRFAFRKASEEAAMDRPQQSLVWLRVAERLERCGDRIDAEAPLFRDIDHLRAAYLRRVSDRPGASQQAPDPDDDCTVLHSEFEEQCQTIPRSTQDVDAGDR
ncbi:hypothetical protein [Brevundimonas sp.]|uniref:hypothetical protein n=1 Tax=Brevundimonas sp. TaxID=1871086 RepID=UPI00286CAA0D|nr:hypothetical protein [Brevundimonas sp.]